jgi:DNA-binding NarL/FixJ family response regulator
MSTGSQEAAGKIRVVVADDHPLMLEAIAARLAGAPDIDVVATVADGRALVAAYDQLAPDVVLSDLAMPEMSGAEATVAIRTRHPDAKVLILSAMDDQASLTDAVRAGAIGYLLKSVTADALCQNVRTAAKGQSVFDSSSALVLAEARTATGHAAGGALSPREAEILALVSRGLTNIEVAAELFISAQTVKSHMERIFSKLAVHTRAAAVREAVSRGLV